MLRSFSITFAIYKFYKVTKNWFIYYEVIITTSAGPCENSTIRSACEILLRLKTSYPVKPYFFKPVILVYLHTQELLVNHPAVSDAINRFSLVLFLENFLTELGPVLIIKIKIVCINYTISVLR